MSLLPFSCVAGTAEAASGQRHTKAVVVTLTLLGTVLPMSAFWTGLATYCTLYIRTTKEANIPLSSCEKLKHLECQSTCPPAAATGAVVASR